MEDVEGVNIVRTEDVAVQEEVDFEQLLLSPPVLRALKEDGFYKPSPIQLKAIPLGKFGLDVIAQAKSGTGKTAVFSVIALESIRLDVPHAQAMVLSPTRELALQIADVIEGLGKYMEGLKVATLIGGRPPSGDAARAAGAHVVVATPGRLYAVVRQRGLDLSAMRVFVLDEADRLLDPGFRSDVCAIMDAIPQVGVQRLAFSATYSKTLLDLVSERMTDPRFVMLCEGAKAGLVGVRQFRCVVPHEAMPHLTLAAKVECLCALLDQMSFHQCVLFTNKRVYANSIATLLTRNGWKSATIHGKMRQSARIAAMEEFRSFGVRILVATDVASRGIDVRGVNFVVHLDLPRAVDSYMHRVGRTGRFGTRGLSVAIVTPDEATVLDAWEVETGVPVEDLPAELPSSLYQHAPASEGEVSALREHKHAREAAKAQGGGAGGESITADFAAIAAAEEAERRAWAQAKEAEAAAAAVAWNVRAPQPESENYAAGVIGGWEPVPRGEEMTEGLHKPRSHAPPASAGASAAEAPAAPAPTLETGDAHVVHVHHHHHYHYHSHGRGAAPFGRSSFALPVQLAPHLPMLAPPPIRPPFPFLSGWH